MKDSIKTLRTMERKDKIKKIGATIATGAMTAMPFMVNAFATAAAGTASAKNIVQVFMGYVIDMFICVGALLGVWAVAQLALAFKNEDADSKSKAMMMLIVAAILIGIAPLATAVLNGTGLTPGSGFLGIR